INDFCVNINQYYEDIDKLISYKLECGCGIKGNCIKYGRYKRTLIINDKKETIYLQRIYCKHCKKTHTIMPKFIVPYERKPFDYILDLVSEYNNKDISKADYEIVRYKHIYKKWENRLKTSELTNGDDLHEVITFCASTFKMCFMQSITRKNSKLNKVEYHVIYSPT
ncbi:MAG: DUF6431 domain-containing protein, partial [Candidatus Coprovivens sp.]